MSQKFLIFRRRHTDILFKGTTEIIRVGKSHHHTNLLHGIFSVSKKFLCLFHADRCQIFDKIFSRPFLKDAAEVIRTDIHIKGYIIQTDLFMIIVSDILLCNIQNTALSLLALRGYIPTRLCNLFNKPLLHLFIILQIHNGCQIIAARIELIGHAALLISDMFCP